MMYETNNISKFAESDIKKFINDAKLPPFKVTILPFPKLNEAEEESPEVPWGSGRDGGGGRIGTNNSGGGGIRAPNAPSASIHISFSEKEKKDRPLNKRKDSKKGSEKQLVGVTYGHYGSGKIYNYYGYNLRVSQNVVVWVNHWKSNKLYKTLAVVKMTKSKPDDKKDTLNYLENKGIKLKLIGNDEITSLKGYRDFAKKTTSKRPDSTETLIRKWKADAKARYEAKINRRLGR